MPDLFGRHKYPANPDGIRCLTSDTGFSSTKLNVIPTPTQAFILSEVYRENVAPVVPLLHRPSVQAILMDSASGDGFLGPDTKSLVLSVCLSAVVTMTDEQCLRDLGERRPVILRCYKNAMQDVFTSTNLWQTYSFQLLQAATLYVTCVRNHAEDPAYVWALTTVLIRRARKIGLHRDGTKLGLKPFEIEMRRRLWWHLCLLDMRTSEDQGTSPELLDVSSNVCLPLNINDDDISPTCSGPIRESIGVTEMTFANIRYEAIRAV